MQYVKILGAASATATTQTHELELPHGGSLFLLLTLHSTENSLSRIEAMRGAVNFLHHEVTKEEFNFNSFKDLFQKTITQPQFQAVCAYINKNLVYVFAIGETKAFLVRNDKLIPLVEGNHTLHSASGYLQPKDSLLLTTEEFLSLVPNAELTPYVIKKKLLALEEDSATRIQESEKRGSCGLVFLSEDFDEREESAPVVEESEPEEAEPTLESLQEEIEVELPAETTESVGEERKEAEEESVVETNPQPLLNKEFFARSEGQYEARGKSKKLAYIGVVLIALLGVSIFFGQKARKAKEEKALVATTLSDAQNALSEAKNISSVNKARARDLIVDAREKVLGVKTENKYPELISMGDALTESLGQVAGVYEIEPTVFSDLALISPNTKASDIALSDNVVRVFSLEDKKIVTVELPGKRTESLSGGTNLPNPRHIGAYAKKTFLLAEDGIYDVGSTAKKQFDNPSSAQDLLFTSFAGNIYVLDKSQNEIWRYAGDGSSFGEKKAWLSEGMDVDFSKASSMAIDGSIWVYSTTGKLTKFTLGNAQTFTLRGLPQNASENAVFFTDGDAQNLYLLDPQVKSVFAFDKTGELLATYTNAAFANAQNIVVSEQNNVILVTAGSKILSVPTRHLK